MASGIYDKFRQALLSKPIANYVMDTDGRLTKVIGVDPAANSASVSVETSKFREELSDTRWMTPGLWRAGHLTPDGRLCSGSLTVWKSSRVRALEVGRYTAGYGPPPAETRASCVYCGRMNVLLVERVATEPVPRQRRRKRRVLATPEAIFAEQILERAKMAGPQGHI